MNKISEVMRHLKGDMKTFTHEKEDDKKLMAKLKKPMKKEKKHERKESKKEKIIEREMHEYKEGKLRSGSKKGPIVENPKQAIAISLSVAKKKMKKKGKK